MAASNTFLQIVFAHELPQSQTSHTKKVWFKTESAGLACLFQFQDGLFHKWRLLHL